MKRLPIILILGAVGSLIGASPVLGAAPSNDDIASPTIVGALPYSEGPIDTSEATTGATDPGFCFSPDIGPDRATVWYSFTPSESAAYLADTIGSDYDTTLYVGVPDGEGGIDVIACVDDSFGLQSAVQWDAEAGTTYLIAVGTCCGSGVVGEPGGGGSLQFNLDLAPPPPTVDIAIDPSGGLTTDGVAVITGTIACSPDTFFVSVSAEVVQRTGRFIVTGFGNTFLFDCGSPWTIFAFSGDGAFHGGKVDVSAFAFACNAFVCSDDAASRTVRLGGIERPAVSKPVGPPPCPGPGPHPGPPADRPPVSGPTKPPVSGPTKPPVSGPTGPPPCPGPVSRSVGGPLDAGSVIAAAFRTEPMVMVGGALAGVISVAGAAGAAAAAQTRRRRRGAELADPI